MSASKSQGKPADQALIDERGGPNAVARALTVAGHARENTKEFPSTTVWGWYYSPHGIPRWWRDHVERLPQQAKIERGKSRAA